MQWIKSSHSLANGCCVEIAQTRSAVLIRDSKDPGGPMLRVTRAAWSRFVRGL